MTATRPPQLAPGHPAWGLPPQQQWFEPPAGLGAPGAWSPPLPVPTRQLTPKVRAWLGVVAVLLVISVTAGIAYATRSFAAAAPTPGYDTASSRPSVDRVHVDVIRRSTTLGPDRSPTRSSSARASP